MSVVNKLSSLKKTDYYHRNKLLKGYEIKNSNTSFGLKLNTFYLDKL